MEISSVGTWAGIWKVTVASDPTLKELAGFMKVPVKNGWSQRRLFEISQFFFENCDYIYIKENLVHWFSENRDYELLEPP